MAIATHFISNLDAMARRMIQSGEGENLSTPSNVGDHTVTLGFGYTLIRKGALNQWSRFLDATVELATVGITLTQTLRDQLDAIAAALTANNTSLADQLITQFQAPTNWTAAPLTNPQAETLFSAELARKKNEVQDQFRKVLGTANGDALYAALNNTREMAGLLSLAYNAQTLIGPTLVKALWSGDRAEAWYQIRYQSNSPSQAADIRAGLAKRRFAEAQYVGLYYDSSNVTIAEAQKAFQMLQLHRKDILSYEATFGAPPDDTTPSNGNRVATANNDLGGALTFAAVGNVPTLIEALTPARDTFITWLNTQLPAGVTPLVAANWNPAAIFYQGADNSLDDGHFNPTLDARSLDGKGNGMDKNIMVGGVGSNILFGGKGHDFLLGNANADLLEGGTGDDILIGGAGEDIYIWNTGDGNDTIVDANGGRLIINGTTYKFTGGTMIQDGTSNVWKDPSGNVKLTHNSPWRLELADGSVIELGEDFDPQKWDINLETNVEAVATPATPGTERTILGDKRPTAFVGTFDAQLTGFQADWRIVRQFNQVTDGDGNVISVDVEYNKTDDLGNLVVDAVADPGRADTLADSAGKDRIEAGAGNDTINAVRGGDDYIDAGAGNDTVQAGTGNDYVLGGAGDDQLDGNDGNDYLQGDAGDDTLNGNEGKDILLGGDGEDQLNGGDGDDTIRGGADHDVLRGDSANATAPGKDVLEGGSGSDTLYGMAGDDALYGADGIELADAIAQGNSGVGSATQGDFLQGMGGDDTLVGTAAKDLLGGGDGSDVLVGGAGDDFLFGDVHHDAYTKDWSFRLETTGDAQTGLNYTFKVDGASSTESDGAADTIYAGAGDDGVLAGGGDDYVDGGAGKDVVFGEGGGDNILGGDGDDILNGDNGIGLLALSKHGNDFIDGGAGNDDINGEGGNDVLLGGAGNDMISGDGSVGAGGGSDYLNGGDGDDQLFGGAGDDIIYGGSGNDILMGDEGADYLDGGDGDDIYIAGAGDTISDSKGNNTLTISNGDPLAVTASGDALLLDYGAQGTVEINGALTGGFASINGVAFGNWISTRLTDSVQVSTTQAGQTVTGGSGDDALTAYHAGASLNGGIGNDTLAAGEFSAVLDGAAGDDVLYSGMGNDTLSGGSGADTYYFDRGNGADVIQDSGDASTVDTLIFGDGIDPSEISMLRIGNDLVLALGSTGDQVTLEHWGSNVNARLESIQFSDGTVWDTALVNSMAFAQPILGTSGNDNLRAWIGESATTMIGGLGDDSYTVTSSEHLVEEIPDEGYDTVVSSVDYTLGANLEALVLEGDAIRGVGNGLDNALIGNERGNTLQGGAGADSLSGGAGNDFLEGGAGNDLLVGGEGADTYSLKLGAGHDQVVTDDLVDGIAFGAGITAASLRDSRTDDGLLIRYGSGDDEVLIDGSIRDFRFADGTRLTADQLFGSTNGYKVTGDQENNFLVDTSYWARDINGGAGDDVMMAGAANTTYRFERGDGADSLLDLGGQDTLSFGEGVTVDDIWFSDESTGFSPSFKVHYGDGDVISIANGAQGSVEKFRFSDGSEVSFDELAGQLGYVAPPEATSGQVIQWSQGADADPVLIMGTAGADQIYSTNTGGNIVVAGKGDDLISISENDGEGRSKLVFDLGDGQDTLIVTPHTSLIFGTGIDPESLRFSTVERLFTYYPNFGQPQTVTVTDTVINYGSQGDRLVLDGFYQGGSIGNIESFEFAGGRSYSYTQMQFLSLFAATGGSGGGGESSTYQFNLGDGVVVINGEPGAQTPAYNYNTVQFGLGIDPTMLSLGKGSLLIRVGNNGDELHIADFNAEDAYGSNSIQSFLFADGTSLTYEELIDRGFDLDGSTSDDVITGTSATDRINGFNGNDRLSGGAGDDVLDGGLGDDVYLFGPGSGVDRIYDHDSGSNIDAVEFSASVLPSDVEVLRNGEDLELHLVDSDDRLVLSNWFSGDAYKIEQIRFADGTVWDVAYLRSLLPITPIVGTSGDDTLFSPGGVDTTVLGLEGNDSLTGSSSDDTLVGDAGDDRLQGNAGSDHLLGGEGNDVIRGDDDPEFLAEAYHGNDYLDGGDGDDQLAGDGGNDTLLGGAGNDVLDGGAGSDFLDGGEGHDTLYAGAGDTVSDLSGWNALYLQDGEPLSVTANGADLVLDYGAKGTLLVSGALQGTIGSFDEQDITDWLKGRLTTGVALSSSGEGQGLFGGDGDDVISSSHNSTYMNGGAGDDILLSTAAYAYIRGGSGNDQILAGSEGDELEGNEGDDHIDAGAGDDWLDGGVGNDVMLGGDGDDYLYGGGGVDRLEGGAGRDTYALRVDSGQITVVDDSIEESVIHLGWAGDLNFDNLQAQRSQQDLLINVLGGEASFRIKDYYASPSSSWVIENANQEVITVQSLIDASLPQWQDLSGSLLAQFKRWAGSSIAVDTAVQRYERQEDGTWFSSAPAYQSRYVGTNTWQQALMERSTQHWGLVYDPDYNELDPVTGMLIHYRLDVAGGIKSIDYSSSTSTSWQQPNLSQIGTVLDGERTLVVTDTDRTASGSSISLQSVSSTGSYRAVWQINQWTAGAPYTTVGGWNLENTVLTPDSILPLEVLFNYARNTYASTQYSGWGVGLTYSMPGSGGLSGPLPAYTSHLQLDQTYTYSLGATYLSAGNHTVQADEYSAVIGTTGDITVRGAGYAYGGAGTAQLIGGKVLVAGSGEQYLESGETMAVGDGQTTVAGRFLVGLDSHSEMPSWWHHQMRSNTRILVDPDNTGVDIIIGDSYEVADEDGDGEDDIESFYQAQGIFGLKESYGHGGQYTLEDPVAMSSARYFDTKEEAYEYFLESGVYENFDEIVRRVEPLQILLHNDWKRLNSTDEGDAAVPSSYYDAHPFSVEKVAATSFSALEEFGRMGWMPQRTVVFGPGLAQSDLGFSWGQLASTWDGQTRVTLDLSWGVNQGLRVMIPRTLDPLNSSVQVFEFSDGTTTTLSQLIALAPPAPNFDVGYLRLESGMGHVIVSVEELQGISSPFQDLGQIEIRNSGNEGLDLTLSYNGGQDSVTIRDWYAGTRYQRDFPVVLDGGGISSSYELSDLGVAHLANGGRDVFTDSDASELLDGGLGNDIIYGGGGNDILIGGGGDDTLSDDVGRNVLLGGAGDDYLIANFGPAFMAGGRGWDYSAGAGAAAVVAYNAGDEADVVFARNGLTLSLGGGLGVEDLQVYHTPSGFFLWASDTDNIRVTDYPANGQINIKLQLIGEDIRVYDLAAALADFLAAGGGSTARPLADYLSSHLLTVSSSEAIGGRLAYEYAITGNVNALTADEMQAIVTESGFGSDAQDIGISHAPVSNLPVTDLFTFEDQSFSYQFAADTFTDADSKDVLTWSVTRADGAPLPGWLVFDASTRTLSGTPANNDVGDIMLMIVATDTGGLSASQTFSLNVTDVKDAPVVDVALGSQATQQEAVFSYSLPQSAFKDIDAGDTLTYSMTLADGTELPNWLSFDAATRTLSGTPTNADVGDLTVKVVATDTGGLSASQSFNLSVANVNDAPQVSVEVIDQSVLAYHAFTYQIPDAAFSDVDVGDSLVYSAILASGASLPSWLQFNPGSRTFTGTPVQADASALQVEVRVMDSLGATASQVFQLTVSPLPVISGSESGEALYSDVAGSVVYGLGGNDTIYGDVGNDVLYGGDGNDKLYAWNGEDLLDGGNGDDILTGDMGDDVLLGGVGIDNLFGDAGNDQIDGQEGNDYLEGNAGDDYLRGGEGNDELVGGSGSDYMDGGLGDDQYVVEDDSDVVVELANEGSDTIISSISLALGLNVENLTLTGSASADASGNVLDNVLTGNGAANVLTGMAGIDYLYGMAGDDVLDGGVGADGMYGGAGNDTYYVDDVADWVQEGTNQGMDAVISTVTRTLASNFENLTLTGTDTINGTGNGLANVLIGNDAVNALSGGAGADTLDGRGGTDTLTGGTGNDTYRLGRGYGSDTVVENDPTAGNTDVAQFLAGISADQIWLRQVGNNLEASVIGSSDALVLKNWYLGSQYHVEQFKTADGKTLLDSQVQNLVQAMASFAPPAAGETTLPTNYTATLNPVIVANWQ